MTLHEALARLERAQLRSGHLPNTRKTYRRVVMDYGTRLGSGSINGLQGYLDYLAEVRRVSPKTVLQALNALVYFEKHVMCRDPGTLRVPRVSPGRRMPVHLDHAECLALLSQLARVPRLQASLLYGCGLRVTEALQLRLKDIDLSGGLLTVRAGKGDKDRQLLLPHAILSDLAEQVSRCRRQWQRDAGRGIVCPSPSPSLARKLGPATFGRLPWYWLFPSRVIRGSERWHSTSQAISKALQDAAGSAGITKRVSPHVLRHSYGTNLLRSGVDIRTIQLQLGHTHVETTEIYCHATGARGVRSPLDAPNVIPLFAAMAPVRPAASAGAS